jgi:hypothetical protein
LQSNDLIKAVFQRPDVLLLGWTVAIQPNDIVERRLHGLDRLFVQPERVRIEPPRGGYRVLECEEKIVQAIQNVVRVRDLIRRFLQLRDVPE